MLEFEKQGKYIAWEIDATAAGCIVPFNVHAHKFIAGHDILHAMTMKFLEDTKEAVEVFKTHIFDAKDVNDEAEFDGSPFVVPETRC
jgi:hypothetical protein